METKIKKPKQNIWTDPSPYGTYTGEAGNPEQWKAVFEQAAFSREKALGVLKTITMSPYEILGIARDATIDQIKTAARKLFVIYHPDKPTGDRAKFDQVMAAYSILTI